MVADYYVSEGEQEMIVAVNIAVKIAAAVTTAVRFSLKWNEPPQFGAD